MISVRRPDLREAERYRQARLQMEPTAAPSAVLPKGFRRDVFTRVIGSGADDFERAKRGLEQWAAHRGSGVEVLPPDAALATGTTVALVTRQVGLWVLAACRVDSVIDEPTRFGFVYVTLPDHPECGVESFTITGTEHEVMFRIEAVSRPGVPLVRLGSPVTRILQRRAADAYLAALHTWVRSASDRP
ncbi:DUF1990 family protein [Aquihabitans sp. McL0605]|uniref:DUF1990 family protein n=1 Tax=Aquihabitans sp. McL0605 TaxID=3415671 RepID=UPI003CEB0A49